jgi:hypothetical protein
VNASVISICVLPQAVLNWPPKPAVPLDYSDFQIAPPRQRPRLCWGPQETRCAGR